MTAVPERPAPGTADVPAPGRAVRAAAVLGALGLLAFAAVNVSFEAADRFATGPTAAYADGLSVMNWLVVALKLLGASVLLLSLRTPSRAGGSAGTTLLLWGAFALFSLYALGSIGEAIALLLGLAGGPGRIDAAGIGYVLAMTAFAGAFGASAVSCSRRTGWRRVPIALGVLGAPVLLAGILVLAPALLVALGVMPAL